MWRPTCHAVVAGTGGARALNRAKSQRHHRHCTTRGCSVSIRSETNLATASVNAPRAARSRLLRRGRCQVETVIDVVLDRSVNVRPRNPCEPARQVPVPVPVSELTVLTAWAEAVAEAMAHAPERVPAVLTEAGSG